MRPLEEKVMLTYSEFLQEGKKDANLHLTHLEDQIFKSGVNGIRSSITFLQNLKKMLSGHTSHSIVNLTVKWDGAPSIFAGTNPENGRFFVATKSLFNATPKLNYTSADVDRNHPSGGLNDKLKVALRYLPELGIRGIVQGDIMFTHDDLSTEQIDGEDCIVFQPNTIVYAVPAKSNLANSIRNAKIGVVWHTEYYGSTMDSLKAAYNVSVSQFKSSRNVWYRDASFVDVSGTATLTLEESKRLDAILSELGYMFRSLSPRFLQLISSSTTYSSYIEIWNNSKVREGEKITNTSEHIAGLIRSVEQKMNLAISTAKRDDTKKIKIAEKTKVLTFFHSNMGQLKLMFDLQNKMIDAKNMLIRKLEQVQGVTRTFIRDADGLKVTHPEGFVCTDHFGNVVKLVDRLTFSHNNFNVSKTWF